MSKKITEKELGTAKDSDVLQVFPDDSDSELYLTRTPEGLWRTIDPNDQEIVWSISDTELVPHLRWWANDASAEPEFFLFSGNEVTEGLEPDSLEGVHPDDVAEALKHHEERLAYHQERVKFWRGES